MKFTRILAVAMTALGLAAGSAHAVGLEASNIGGNTVFADPGNGNVLALFGLKNASVGDTLDLAGVQDLQQSGPSILNIFAGDPSSLPPAGFRDGALVGSPALFSNVNDGVEVDALSSGGPVGSVFDALFLEFDPTLGTTLVFDNGGGGTSTFALSSKSEQIAFTPIPVPAALPLMASGLAALGFLGRRRRQRGAA